MEDIDPCLGCDCRDLSTCCGAEIIMGDICSDCGEHCDNTCDNCDFLNPKNK